jgi:outer membrane biosynthesis protein TonB
MRHVRTYAFALGAFAFASVAQAEEQDKTAPPAEAPEQSAPAATSAPAAAEQKPQTEAKPRAVHAPSAKTAQEGKPAAKPQAAQPAALSKTAYLRVLSAELRRLAPTSPTEKGSVNVFFTVGPKGRVTSHQIKQTSNPALEPLVARILASVHTPPPPGGSFSAAQQFNFH